MAARRPRSRKPGWPPRWLTRVPPADRRRGDGDLYADLIGATCRVTKDSVAAPAGALLEVRVWQREILRHVFARRADGRLRHRSALVGIARKNGKSGLGAGVAIGGMLLGPSGGEVYSCAGDREQARIVFGTARRMIEMDRDLSQVLKLYRDVIEVPATGTIYRALSSEAFTKEGLNPHLVVFDEVHVQPTRELWDVMAQAMGSRIEPLMLGITTAGGRTDRTGQDSLCYSMYQYGQRIVTGEVTDPTFFMAWWEPWDGSAAPHDQPRTWREANPGYGDLVAPADFESTVRRTQENAFRNKRCNQWTTSSRVWLPAGGWDAIADPMRYDGGLPDRTRCVLAFDGSKSGDSTALLAITIEERPHISVLDIWEKDPDDTHWRIPRTEAKNTIRAACRRLDVAEIAWDDYMWQDAREELEDERLPIEVFPQTPERMGKATQRFYEAVVDKGITHDGDPRLARHIGHAVPKPTNRGLARIVKETPDSTRWIDAAVTAVFGLDRAEWWSGNVAEGPNIW